MMSFQHISSALDLCECTTFVFSSFKKHPKRKSIRRRCILLENILNKAEGAKTFSVAEVQCGIFYALLFTLTATGKQLFLLRPLTRACMLLLI